MTIFKNGSIYLLIKAAFILIIMHFTSGCAPGVSKKEIDNMFPSTVSPEDRAECESKGHIAGQEVLNAYGSSKPAEWTATYGGLLGGLFIFGGAGLQEEAAYRQAVKECLEEKGYAVSDDEVRFSE